MPIAAIGGAIGGVSSLVGGILGSGAASDAAKVQAQGAQNAQNLEAQNQASALAAQKGATQQETANAQPYTTAGAGAVGNLSNLLAMGGSLTTPYSMFDPNSTNANITADPGYNFRLQQGNAGIQNSAAARGGLLSTGTLKNLDAFNSGEASQEYNNAYSRALSTYNTNASNYYTGQNNTYSRLMGLSQLGQNSTLNLNNLLQSGAVNTSNIDMTGGAQQAQQINNAAAARASGYVGSANAWEGALGGPSGGANTMLNAFRGGGGGTIGLPPGINPGDLSMI